MQYQHAEIESRYQELQPAGAAVDYAGRSFENFDLREFLTQCLPQLQFTDPQPRVLEYGTGTGPGACFLAARGFRLDAIDRSPTAIEMARRFAAERSFDIHYEVQDICTFAAAESTYDLVIDSYCLHRIIADADRVQAMGNVRRMLKPNGCYVIGSVVYRPDRDYGPEQFDKATGIVYAELADDPSRYRDAVQIDGRWLYARHRHVTSDHLRRELVEAGFQVLEQTPGAGRFLCQLRSLD
jgi:SAM-dependent methyltransferase